MLGTAQNFISVGLGIAAAAAVAEAIHSGAAWPLAAAAAALVFLAAESAETLLAELVEERRGDPDAREESDG